VACVSTSSDSSSKLACDDLDKLSLAEVLASIKHFLQNISVLDFLSAAQ